VTRSRLSLPPTALTVVLALSFLLGLQPVATDLYLPALPQMPVALGVSITTAQWTLSIVVMAFGLGQLVWGPVSDRLGRRPALLAGLGLFVVASAFTVWAPTFDILLMARAAQGLGLASAVVCGRAMIRDLYQPQEGARVLSKGLSGLGIIALVGPILGGLVATHLGWRATLGVVGLFALSGLIYIASCLPESLPLERRQSSQNGAWYLRQWHSVSVHPMFRAYTALTSATYGGLYVYLAASSFVFIDTLGASRQAYGLLLASTSLSYLIGTVLCRRWLAHRGLPGTVRLGARFSMASGLWCLGLSAWAWFTARTPSAWALLPGVWLYAVGHGLHQPCSQAGIVAPFPQQAGAASALSGFIMSGLAVGIGALLGLWMKAPGWIGTIHPLTLGMGLGGFITAWVGLGLVQRDGHPAVATVANTTTSS
jgi:DHA1 family bicyclomycin/chloramphenicol resistance-like MFS transporter